MNALKKLSFWLGALLFAGGVANVAFGQEAKVLKLTGSATVLMPDGSTRNAAKGMVVPQGASIVTGPSSQVFLQVFSGGIATISENSNVGVEKLAVEKSGDTVTSQEALLDLKKGTVVSTLDPAKKAINHYGVRTPKGVAAARGTVYAVTVGEDKYVVEVTDEGEVTFTPVDANGDLDTSKTVTIGAGGAVSVGADGSAQSLDADQAANNPLVQTARSVMSVVLAIITNNAGGEFTGETDAAAAAQANITAAAGRTPVTEVDPNQVSVSHR